MAGGSVRIAVDAYGVLTAVAQRVLCWALTDKGKIGIDTGGRYPMIVIPEAVIGGKGALLLKRGGTDVVAGYVAGTNVVYNAVNGGVASGTETQDVNTCPSSAAQPNGSISAYNVGGNPYAVTLLIDNLAAGNVNVNWGDGTSTLGVAQAGSTNHTYPSSGEWTITITDADAPTQFGSFTIRLPYNL